VKINTHLYISLISSYNDKCFISKSVETIKMLIVFITLFLKSRLLWDNLENYCTTRQATDDNMAHAHWMLGN
jgi:hypothetical protein